MRVAILNDSHWGCKKSNRVFEEHIAEFHDRFLKYLVQNDIKTILHLGDFFDVRGSINNITLQTVKNRFISKLKPLGINMVIVPGNHDMSYRHVIDANSVALAFNEYESVTVYEEPTVVSFEDGSKVLMVPWIAKDHEKEFLEKIDLAIQETDICLGHFEFSGFLYAKGVVADSGMDSTIFTPKFDLILSGHYHSKSSKGNIHYLGTQYQLTWSDYDEKKYFHVLDTKTKELVAVENPVQMFNKVFYDESLVDESDLKDIKTLDLKDKVVKVVVLNRKNMVKFEMFMEAIYEHSPYHVEVVDESVVSAQKELKVDSSILIKGTMEIINDILDDINLESYNVEEIKRIMNDLYHESAA